MSATAIATDNVVEFDRSEEHEHLLRRFLGEQLFEMMTDEQRRITDIWCNEDGEWWYEEDRIKQKIGIRHRPEIVKQIINHAANLGGTVANYLNPVLETDLPWGQRFTGVLPPLTLAPVCTIRVHRRKSFSLESYLKAGRIDPMVYEFLDRALHQRRNIVVIGTTGSGKTAFLDAMFGHPAVRDERILVAEETRELRLDHVPDKVRMRINPRSKDVVSDQLNALVRVFMRKRPDRAVIGEARGKELLEWLKMIYSGHGGGMLTAHADDPTDAMSRFEMMLAEGVADMRAFRPMLVNAIHRIVWMRRDKEVGWKAVGLYEPIGYDHERAKYEVDTLAGIPTER